MGKKLTKEEKVEKLFNKYIKDVEPNKKNEIVSKFDKEFENDTLVNIIKNVSEYLGFDGKAVGRHATEYWIKRGWKTKPANVKITTGKRKSPFSKEHWIEKGYSEEEAEYKRNSIRPIRKEYWIEKGYSEEESILKAQETKTNNNKKASEKTKNTKKLNGTSYDYWYAYHMGDVEKAKKSLHERQSTFSLEKCIKKHGEIEGTKIWKERQTKWQTTLKNNNNMIVVNSSKSTSVQTMIEKGISNFEITKMLQNHKMLLTHEEFIDKHKRQFCKISNLVTMPIDELFNSVSLKQWYRLGLYNKNDVLLYMKNNLGYDESKTLDYRKFKNTYKKLKHIGYNNDEIQTMMNDTNIMSIDDFVKKYNTPFYKTKSVEEIFETVSTPFWCINGVFDIQSCHEFLIKHVNYDISNVGTAINKNGYGYLYNTNHGVLRSSYEKEFYDVLIDNNITNFELEKKYENTNMKCDFYINGIYIEIAPMYNFDFEDLYTKKMNYKRDKFGSLLITTKNKEDYKRIIKDFVECYLKK